jgi:proteasome lid subunit RPN8/RPN11
MELPEEFWRAYESSPGVELCGLLFERDGRLGFRRLENLGGLGEFWIDEIELIRVERDLSRHGGCVVAFVHSHVHSAEPSNSDRLLAMRSRWPFLLVAPDGDVQMISA